MTNVIKNIFKVFDNSSDYFNFNRHDRVDPNIIRYFRIEYGTNWESALAQHLYKERLKKQKKAA